MELTNQEKEFYKKIKAKIEAKDNITIAPKTQEDKIPRKLAAVEVYGTLKANRNIFILFAVLFFINTLIKGWISYIVFIGGFAGFAFFLWRNESKLTYLKKKYKIEPDKKSLLEAVQRK